MSDLINRQDVIDILYKCTPFDSDGIKLMERLEERINALPSADPSRKRGQWEDEYGNRLDWRYGDGYCSVCGAFYRELTWYCGDCGAEMDVELEADDETDNN